MDCRQFRNEHLAYLDDTLPGTVMAEAQRHLMGCDACAAHDQLVRRSLMMVRNLPELEPSAAFGERLQARLAACKAAPAAMHDDDAEAFLAPPPVRAGWRRRPVWLAMAAGVAIVGTVSMNSSDGRAAEPELAPMLAAAPVPPAPLVPEFSPALLQAMSTGNPM
jgi:anti-sigma factor RsiW